MTSLLLARAAVRKRRTARTVSRLHAALAAPVELRSLEHEDLVWNAVFSPDEMRILSASGEDLVRVWSTKGQLIRTLPHGHPVHFAWFSGDESRILTESWTDGFKDTRTLWDAEKGQELAVLDDSETSAFSSDSSHILTRSRGGAVRLWTSSGQLAVTLQGHTAPVISAAFSPDGLRIVTASADKTARFWSSKGKQMGILEAHEDAVVDATFSPDGSRIATAWRSTVRVHDSNGVKRSIMRAHSSTVWSVAFSPNGSRIATGRGDRAVRLWNAAELKVDTDGPPPAKTSDGRGLTIDMDRSFPKSSRP